jgi:hypothetical protein
MVVSFPRLGLLEGTKTMSTRALRIAWKHAAVSEVKT